MLREYYEFEGRYFIADKDRYAWGGRVISRIGPDLYMIEGIDPIDWEPHQPYMTYNSAGMDNWHWYESVEEWKKPHTVEYLNMLKRECPINHMIPIITDRLRSMA